MGRKRLNLAGKKFESWEVLKFSHIQETKRVSMWKCRCKCGKEKILRGSSLVNGDSKSCGTGVCTPLGLEKTVANFNHIFRHYKRNAKNKNLQFSLTEKEFKKLTSENCHYCNKEPSNRFKAKSTNGAFIYNGIDRKDNIKGYTLENSLPCCKICNFLKKDMPYLEFLNLIKIIYTNRINKENI